ncbi:prepilin-type N-terminal cleavage/methylation domain-containing protein [Shewanella algae]|uniref:prepilin-type N-terminal cleavage/methylation domain-containing protein n=1 Tax=Shewanella algae TaxID=38313 RepID=UPI0011838ACC|nr:prepilin-type N-terminal cleavage/methylation domain-containing protein [Shewanella algae]MBO2597896.1 type II secretion system protein [Shewanella algae]TVL52213.1 MSHA biogenesis protein MshA [Shewanella algae]
MQRQQGFTLIELVVVIIILGILAVVAAPKFINLQSDARASALQGMKGAIQGANSLVYSKAALAGVEKQPSTTLNIAGTTAANDDVAIVFGYMAATQAALEAGMDARFDAGTSPTANGSNDWVISEDENNKQVTIWQRGAPADVADPAASCKIVYVEPKEAGALPTITLTDNGC